MSNVKRAIEQLSVASLVLDLASDEFGDDNRKEWCSIVQTIHSLETTLMSVLEKHSCRLVIDKFQHRIVLIRREPASDG